MFSEDRKKAAALFKDHTKEKNSDACLDYEERLHVSDNEVVEYLKELGIVAISELQELTREERDVVIRKMKEHKGVTLRQLARLTGISKSVIDRT